MSKRAPPLARRLAFALGLPLALASTPACKSRERPGERPDRAPAATATTTTDHEARCERGTFCVPPQASIEVAAPSPYQTCSVITPLPAGVPAGWEQARRAKLRIWFHADSTAAARPADPQTCCYEWREHCAGRPLREDGRPLVADAVSRGTDWFQEVLPRGSPDVLPGSANPAPARRRSARRAREIGAAHWTRNALLEHASVAAFGRVALDLLALGAPADLVVDTHAAALDEVRHARLSFSIAAQLGAAVSGPGPLHTDSILKLANPERLLRETFRDGCVGEAAAALVLEAAARRAGRGRRPAAREAAETPPSVGPAPISATLKTMADDEARHAELAWRTVAWLATTFPAAEQALREELDSLRIAPSPASASPTSPRRPAARHGVWSAADMARARAAAVEIALSLGADLLAKGSHGAPTSGA